VDIQLSQRVLSIKPSPTLAVTKKAAELKAAGKDIIGLGAGEPDFDTPEHVKAAAVAAIGKGFTKYTAVDGTPSLKQAIIAKFKRDQGLDYAANQILVSCGGKQSFFNLSLALLNPGDEVIIPAPFWVSYPDMVIIADGTPVIVECPQSQGYKITAAQLEAAITPKTRLLVLNSPSNPTGMVYSKAELLALVEVLRKHPHVMIATDDMYEHIIWTAEKYENIVTVAPDLYDRTIVLNGVSKAYAMTGWRIGFVAGNALLVRAYGDVKDNSDSGQFLGIQKAGAAGLDEVSIPKAIAAKYSRRMDKLVGVLAKLGFQVRKPGAGFFLYMPAPKSATGPSGTVSFDSGEAFSQWMITEHLISTVPWDDCGSFVRFSVTFVSDKGEAGEGEVIAEVERRLSAWKFSF